MCSFATAYQLTYQLNSSAYLPTSSDTKIKELKELGEELYLWLLFLITLITTLQNFHVGPRL